jgi:glycosyltransferase involved in cell wall biosynthesis
MTDAARSQGNRRLIFDVSSILQWLGPPVGILRREHELARHALTARPDIRFSYFDKSTGSFRAVNAAWIERLIGWEHAIDVASPGVRRSRSGIARLKPSRYLLTMALERQRLSAKHPAIQDALALGQRFTWLPHRMRLPFAAEDGTRFGILPTDLALGAALDLTPGDTLLSVGDDWLNKEVGTIAGLKRHHGFRCTVMCHDLIPIMFPDFFPERVATLFRRHWTAMFAIADRILVNSRRVEADIREFCRQTHIAAGDIVLVRPGCDLIEPDPGQKIPAGLEPGKFALYVSTIEPRKGHAMLIDVWRQLVADGIPQRRGFKLVLAGRPGWNVEAVMRQIADSSAFQGTLLHFATADDRMVSGLYRDAAFCLFPSYYEGFGVPIVEAFAHGKAVIASTGGALPETVGSLSPCLPIDDRQAWLTAIRAWIEDESLRRPWEQKIHASFSHPRWAEAAARIFEAARV